MFNFTFKMYENALVAGRLYSTTQTSKVDFREGNPILGPEVREEKGGETKGGENGKGREKKRGCKGRGKHKK